MSIFKATKSSAMQHSNSYDWKRNPFATLKLDRPKISRVSDGVKVDGVLEAERATLKLEIVKEIDCLAMYSCEVRTTDSQGNELVQTNRLLQRPKQNLGQADAVVVTSDVTLQQLQAFVQDQMKLMLASQDVKLKALETGMDSKLKDLHETFEGWAGKCDDLNSKSSALNEKLGALDDRFGALDGKLGTSDDRFGALDDKLGTLDDRFGALDDKLGTLDDRFGALDDKLGTLDDRFGALDGKLGTLDDRFGALDDKLGTLDDRFGALDGKLGTLDDKFRALDGKLGTLDDRFGALDDKLGTVDDRFGVLDGKLGALGDRFIAFDGKLGALGGKIETLDGTLGAFGARFGNLDSRLDAIGNILKDKIQNAHSQLDSKIETRVVEKVLLLESKLSIIEGNNYAIQRRLNEFEEIITNSTSGLSHRVQSALSVLNDTVTVAFEKLKIGIQNSSIKTLSAVGDLTAITNMTISTTCQVLNSAEDNVPNQEVCAKRSDPISTGSDSSHFVIQPSRKSKLDVPYPCDPNTDGGGWIVIQRRASWDVDFDRNWDDYKEGFGSLSGDFWLGNKYIHALTSSGKYELRVDLDYDGMVRFAYYSSFAIDDEENNYTMRVGRYDGSASDGLTRHNETPFSTYDKDHDDAPQNLAMISSGAWWNIDSLYSNLNAKWGRWGGIKAAGKFPSYDVYYVSFSEMKIREL